jgi:DNA-binding PadR family transcriptional regulator
MFRHFFDFESQPHARVFRKGDIKYVILDLLKDKPSHGYDIMRALEERFHGLYSPSPGSVYPTLQLLGDMGYVTSAVDDTKKVYSITEEGKKFLTEHKETIDKIKDYVRDWWDPKAASSHRHHSRRGRGWWGPQSGEEFSDTLREWGEVARFVGNRARHLRRDKLSRIREIMIQARHEIEKVVSEEK